MGPPKGRRPDGVWGGQRLSGNRKLMGNAQLQTAVALPSGLIFKWKAVIALVLRPLASR